MSTTKNHSTTDAERGSTGGERAACATEQLREKAADVKQTLQEMGALARDAAQEKVGELHEAVKQTASQWRDAAQQKVDEFRETAQQAASELRDSAGEYYNRGQERAHHIERTLEARIREKPLRSLLMAAGAGVLIGILWSRR